MKKYVYFYLLLFVHLISMPSHAQVEPDINSGNPAHPFPQFLPYAHPDGTKLGNLADHNPEGVPHAELEQRTRDAWKIMCNNIVEVPNAKVGGVQYLASNATLDCKCAEAYGYYMLGAAYMADQKTYNGLFMYYHDNSFNGVNRFIDGKENKYGGYNRGLSYAGSFGAGGAGFDPYGGAISGNSATDGDHDIALAMLVAYKQWGEKSGVLLPNGKELNYKEEALNYIRAMADTGKFALSLPVEKYFSGDIGLDGYIKGGDTWNELTDFAQGGYNGMKPERSGGEKQHFDYYAPAYYRQFSDWLTELGGNAWHINQFKRGEASSDWLMGQLYNQGEGKLPYVGYVGLKGTTPEFSIFSDGEDFRAAWRTILNYTWHGNPTYSWDPITHQVIAGTNTFEKDMAGRLAKFLNNPKGAPWNNACSSFGTVGLTFKGTGTVSVHDLNGKPTLGSNFTLNWLQGSSAPGAVASQDFNLMGQMFRQCVIEWDAHNPGYLNSKPLYYHEWFRLLGMMVLTGNHHAPSNMKPAANLKVYHKVDKTLAFSGDQVTFTIDYRNYGSLDATGSKITFEIPSALSYVSSSKQGTLSGSQISWDLGTVTGFKTGKLDATKGQFTVTFKLSSQASGGYCIAPTISCTNGSGWVSNEYPNNQTAVMERNCVDVVKRALKITKTADRNLFNPGDSLTYTISFTNTSDAGWINGGRPGVNFSFAHDPMSSAIASTNVMKFRIFNDANEAYIDYGNYRFSYFINEPSINCFAGETGCASGWSLMNTIYEGGVKDSVRFFREGIVPGSDARGSWNQRVVIKFAPQLATTSQHLLNYSGLPNRVKEGGLTLLRGVWRLSTSNHNNISWRDDWSWDSTAADTDGGIYFPVTPDWTNPVNINGIPVTSWHRNACQTATKTVDNVLVEEWDGYVWKRIFGNGPLPGRDVENVVVTDTLPVGLNFGKFRNKTTLGIAPTYDSVTRVIRWSIPKLLISQVGNIIYTAAVNVPSGSNCPTANETVVSKAWIQGKSESPFADVDTIAVTCTKVVVCNSSPTFNVTTGKSTYAATDPSIDYTIKYKQTEGSIGKSDLNTGADWTTQSGTGISFGAGALTAAGQSNFVATHNFSHGTNTIGEGIQGTLALSRYAKFGLVLRYDAVAKTGVYLIFKPDYNSIQFEIYNAAKLLKTGAIPFNIAEGAYINADFQIKLNGDKIDLWLGKAPFEGPSMYSTTGLLVQPGYAGVVHGTIVKDNTSSHKITYWIAHLDSGFDLSLKNPVPNGTASPSVISAPGILTGNDITWNLSQPGIPVLAGKEFQVTWTAQLQNCSEGIVNNVFANLKGQPTDGIKTCNLIKCTSVGPADSITLTVENTVKLTALLKWKTTSNIKVKEFLVTKSVGGGIYTTLTTVAAVSGAGDYSFEDRRPTKGVSYYQVKQINQDGTSLISAIVTFGYNGDLSFRVDNVDGHAELSWASNSETNTIKYEVQRSPDGKVWETIISQEIKGTGKLYNYNDLTPLNGNSNYRIRQMYKDGTSIYSAVISFEGPNAVRDKQQVFDAFVFPNPVENTVNVIWNTSSYDYSIRIISTMGVVHYTNDHITSGSQATITLPGSMSAGKYILEFKNAQSVFHYPIVKY